MRLLARSRAAALSAGLALLAAGCTGDDSAQTADGGDTGGLSASASDTPADSPAATPGVDDDTIVLGQSAALSGPAQALGQGMELGIRTAFHEVNQQGGVHGRRLELRSLDDGYEPEAALDNTRSLIGDQVFALIGATGTPTSEVAAPEADRNGVPYIAPFTGAELLRDGKLDNVVNLRASYAQETATMVERLTQDLNIERIAVLFQDDSFGRDGYRGVLTALEERGMMPVAIQFYRRNTVTVKNSLLDLVEANPEAVIIIGAYKPAAELILWARQVGFNPVYMTVSFVGADALAAELGTEGEGVFVTQVVPFPDNRSTPVVAAYLDALEAYDREAEPGFVSLEGYLAGRLAIEGLERCGRAVTRECLLDELLGAEVIDIDGLRLMFTDADEDAPDATPDNQGSDDVFLTAIDSEGKLKEIAALDEALP